jgi:excisionase family DNA binding protein
MSKEKCQFYSVKEAANLLGCTLKYIYDLLYMGRLQADKQGRTWRIRVSSLDTLVKQRRPQ